MHGYCVIPNCGAPIEEHHDLGVCDTCGARIARRYSDLVLREAAEQQGSHQARWTESRAERLDREARSLPDLFTGYVQPDNSSFVYYARIGNHIKIGYTTNVLGRMSALRVHIDDLLALEPGGQTTEQMRHEQFAHLRITKRWENFQPEADLLAHIAALVHDHGLPKWLRPPNRNKLRKNGPVEVRHRDDPR